MNTWTREGDLAVYTVYIDFNTSESIRYNYESIVAAIANVKATRSIYVTEEAYQRQLSHFEEGLALFGNVP